MKVEVAVLGYPSLIDLVVSLDVKELERSEQELCQGRGGRAGLPVPNSPYGLCGRKATLEEEEDGKTQELCESLGGFPGLPDTNSPIGRCGRNQH